MICLVTGDRKYKHPKKVHAEIYKRRKKIKLLIQGGAKGADQQAYEAAMLLGIPTATCDANWQFFGRRAGPIRNSTMVKILKAFYDAGENVLVLAFHSNLRKSKGTADMVRRCKQAKFTVKVVK